MAKYEHKLYNTYSLIVNRCTNPNADDYQYYGGRGISICDRWLGENGFYNFLDDMGERPIGHTIERIDTNKNYYKENCKWENVFNQRYNRRRFKNNKSGVTGVSFKKKLQKWVAQISKNGKVIHLGYFDDFEEAVMCRKEAELKYYGKLLDYK